MRIPQLSLILPLLGAFAFVVIGLRNELSQTQQDSLVPPPEVVSGRAAQAPPSPAGQQLDLSTLPLEPTQPRIRRPDPFQIHTGQPLQPRLTPRYRAGFLPANQEQISPLPTTPSRPNIAPQAPLPLFDQDTQLGPESENQNNDRSTPAVGDAIPFLPQSDRGQTPFQTQPRVTPTLPQVQLPNFGNTQPVLPTHDASCSCGCQPTCVTQTVTVPVWETRYVNSVQTRYRPEQRQRRFRKYYTVYDMVPKVESYTVNVPQPRTRQYTVNIKQEYQEQVQENFTVMVPEPRQREVTTDREESYQVPVEVPYTVMVPERKAYQETSYKTVIEKEPYQEKYVVQVPKQKTRVETTYRKEPIEKTVYKPVVRMSTQTRKRPKVKYREEERSRTVTEEYFEYVTKTQRVKVERFRNVPSQKRLEKTKITYRTEQGFYDVFEYSQEATPRQQAVTYTNYVLDSEPSTETYYVNEPYQETVTRTYPIKVQTPRTVTKTYPVKLPVVQHVPQQYMVNVPYETMETRYRTVSRQVPITRYRTITRDLGRWERKQVTCPTCQLFTDGCGCASCVAGMQTCVRNVWCPKIVTQRIPYTDFKEVAHQIPYQVPQLRQRQEVRVRQVPITRYRTETRTASLQVYDFQDSQRSQSFEVTKYRWVAKQRPITLKKIVEQEVTKNLPFYDYAEVRTSLRVNYEYRTPMLAKEPYTETVMVSQPYQDFETVEVTEPVKRSRQRTERFTVRVPYVVDETYEVRVPVTEMMATTETDYVEVPEVKEVVYTEQVPEIRTRMRFREIKKKVPVFTTKYKTEMVPQIRTRTISRTETRTVTDKQMKTYMVSVPEVLTRTVYKTRYRDVPQTRTEVYWVQVPETRYRVTMQRVPRQVAREHLQTYTVQIPYQVQVSVPVQVCRMVTRTITVPVETCCDQCLQQFGQLREVSSAYLKYSAECLQDGCRQILETPWRRTW